MRAGAVITFRSLFCCEGRNFFLGVECRCHQPSWCGCMRVKSLMVQSVAAMESGGELSCANCNPRTRNSNPTTLTYPRMSRGAYLHRMTWSGVIVPICETYMLWLLGIPQDLIPARLRYPPPQKKKICALNTPARMRPRSHFALTWLHSAHSSDCAKASTAALFRCATSHDWFSPKGGHMTGACIAACIQQPTGLPDLATWTWRPAMRW